MSSLKTLYIIRHSKSSWTDADLTDFDRSLDARGILDAQLVFSHWANELKGLQHIASSPARRAKSTSVLVCQVVDIPQSLISFNPSLYEASEADVYAVVKSFPKQINTAAVVGHNPSLIYFANKYLKIHLDNLPTTGLVKLVFNCNNWDQISSASLVESQFDFPKNH